MVQHEFYMVHTVCEFTLPVANLYSLDQAKLISGCST